MSSEGTWGGFVQSELLNILDLAQAFVRDLDGTIRYWSTGAGRLYGWTAAEALGRVSHELLRTGFPQPLRDIQSELLQIGVWHGELCHVARNEQEVTVASHWALYRGETSGSVEVVELNHDISELKSAQRELVHLRKEGEVRLEELREACEVSHRLSAIVESSNDAIISKSLDGRITSWNSGAEKLFGYKAAEVMGKPVSMLASSDRVNEMPEILKRIRSGEAVASYETVRRRKDGRLIDVSLTVSPIFNAQGQVVGASKTARDITDKKRAERRLLNINAELRQFAYAAAHDLQEPIRDISLHAQIVERLSFGQLSESAKSALTIVMNSARRMQRLIGDLLIYTEATTGPELVEPISSASALTDVTRSLAVEISQSGAAITSDELPTVLMHRSHLTKIFEHLIGNAIKFRRNERPEVHVSAQRNGADWCFCVRDNGIGIEAQHWTRIFGVFKRLHGREIPGTGIGLAVCHRIVTHHGGRMWVESTVGSGSAFYFTVLAAMNEQR